MTQVWDVTKFHHLVGQQAKGQPRLSLFSGTGECDQVRLGAFIEHMGLQILRMQVMESSV